MEEQQVNDIASVVWVYWRDLLKHLEDQYPTLQSGLEEPDYDALRLAIRALSPRELATTLAEDSEEHKFHYMLKVWCRYLDIMDGNTLNKIDHLYVTDKSSIHELCLTSESLKELHGLGIQTIEEITENSKTLSYETLADTTAAAYVLDRRLILC